MAGGPVPTVRSLASERSPAFRRADAATGREATNPLVGQAARLTDTQGAPGRRLRRLGVRGRSGAPDRHGIRAAAQGGRHDRGARRAALLPAGSRRFTELRRPATPIPAGALG